MILVTGGNGFVGKNLIAKIGEEGVAWDIKFGRDIFANDIEPWVQKAEAIVHLAALTSNEGSFENPRGTFELNVDGTLRMLLLAEKYRKKFIFASSAAVYSDTGRNSYREVDELNSESPYGQSKIDAEYLCAAWRRHFPIVVLRFFNIYGLGQNQAYAGVITKYLELMNTGTLPIYGDGEQTRDFINVKDVVNVIIDAVTNSDWNGRIVNVGTGKGTSVNQIAGIFKRNNRKVKEFEYLPARQEIRHSVADNLFLRTLYQKPLETNLGEDLEMMIKELK